MTNTKGETMGTKKPKLNVNLTISDRGYEYNDYLIQKTADGWILRIGNALAFRGSSPYAVAKRAALAGY